MVEKYIHEPKGGPKEGWKIIKEILCCSSTRTDKPKWGPKSIREKKNI